MPSPLLETNHSGLYCQEGDFYIDPWKPVPRALITHAHSDHAQPNCGTYLTSNSGEPLLRERVGSNASIESLPYIDKIRIKGCSVSFHPAGHILGSSQIKVSRDGFSAVFSGDYKRDNDGSCECFEPVPCEEFITESTFALPVYQWKPPKKVFAEIADWCKQNALMNRTSVLFAYALGKSQRLLKGLENYGFPIAVHGSVMRFIPHYLRAGVLKKIPLIGNRENLPKIKGKGLLIAPISTLGSPWLKKFSPYSIAGASGWMQLRGNRRRKGFDRGFVLSDHADWKDILQTIKETGASKIGATHGFTDPLVQYLDKKGYQAYGLKTNFRSEELTSEV